MAATTATATDTAAAAAGFHFETDIAALRQSLQIGSAALAGTRTTPTRLLVFDFDSTLFRSPLPNPEIWASDMVGTLVSDCGWFSESRTLAPPFLPEVPDASWWDQDVVEEVRRSVAAGDALTVLLTGRRRDVFLPRISRLAATIGGDGVGPATAGVSFDLILLKEFQDGSGSRRFSSTVDFKLAVLSEICATFQEISHVEIWDDRRRHVELFCRFCKQLCADLRVRSYAVHYVVQNPDLKKHIPADLEKDLVMDMISTTNERIRAAQEQQALLQQGQKQPPVQTGDGASPGSRPQNGGSAKLINTRRKSASAFRSVMEPVVVVQVSALSLDAASRAALVAAIAKPAGRRSVPATGVAGTDGAPPPPAVTVEAPVVWATRADRAVLCLGRAPRELLQSFGGSGATVVLRAVSVGVVPDRVVAVRVERVGGDTAAATTSVDETAATAAAAAAVEIGLHVVVYVAAGAKAREAERIAEWVPLAQPVELSATVALQRATGLRRTAAAGAGAGDAGRPREVSIGDLVMRHHPQLKGRQIGVAVRVVREWMEKTFIENLTQNAALVEAFVSNLDASDPDGLKYPGSA
ncbi:hypothetical protein HK405_009623 [Cladochytrium tenue]|nr:hypothetical protein HK405_009623 [Cladochytrium tenue]